MILRCKTEKQDTYAVLMMPNAGRAARVMWKTQIVGSRL